MYARPTAPRALTTLAMFTTLTLLALLALVGCSGEPVVVESDSPAPSAPTTVTASLDGLEIELTPIADGFEQPLFVTGAGDGSGRLFVLEKTGRAWILRDGKRLPEPFLDLADVVSTTSEQGLLGMAFAPSHDGKGLVFANYTRGDGATVISRFKVDGDRAVRDSETILMTIAQPYPNHNGGMIEFGPDGHLYIGMGDGGSGGDPEGNGQNPSALLGKMLRIDVAPENGAAYAVPDDNPFVGRDGWRPEIWALGLRNPWRFSFDRETGDLWIGDVGQNAWEEIDFQSASSAGGENYGWNTYEGAHPYPEGSPSSEGDFTDPVIEYDRATGTSVTGGYVYRGPDPALQGIYFYADFSVGRVWGALRAADGSITTRELLDTDMYIASFGEGDDGTLYLADFNSGGIYRIDAK